MLPASLFNSFPTVSGGPVHGCSDNPSEAAATGRGITPGFVEKRLQQRDARPSHRRVRRWIRRVYRASLRIGHRQQIRLVTREDARGRGGVEHLRMQRIARGADLVIVDAPAELLGTQAAMQRPTCDTTTPSPRESGCARPDRESPAVQTWRCRPAWLTRDRDCRRRTALSSRAGSARRSCRADT